ncbi:vps10 domain-containing receptor 2 [Limosa lapponica baueri]|uniref:Vps10 domain-containing receptor 2 n=1 Tax=Limosa lapponica baueri TaxID=1758121 RepID=A0A2I0UIC5_LIMLA|nr:vps10 domain-containing receptor 2 [Limosa lapponica baueri]
MVAGWASGVASVRRDQELLLCWTEPVPAISKTDPPLAKADPVSDAGGASVITYLRKGKKCCAAVVRERSEKNMRERALKTPRPVKKEGKRCSRHKKKYSPAAHGEDHSEVGCLPAAHEGPHARTGECAPKKAAAHGHLMPEQAPGRTCSLWRGAQAGAGSLAGPAAYGGPTLEQSVPEGLYPVERTHAGAVLESYNPWEGPTLKKFMKHCSPWEGLHDGEGEQHEGEGVAETKCYELTTTPIPHSTAHFRVLEGRYKVSLETSLLQAEQPQLSQPVFTEEVLQSSDHLCGPPLDPFQKLHVLPVLRTPELDTVLQVNCDISRLTDLTADKCCHSSQDGGRKTEYMDAGGTEELEMAISLWKNQEAVGGKTLDHLDEDNNLTVTTENAPAAGVQSGMANCTYLLQKIRLVGANASLRREFEATLDGFREKETDQGGSLDLYHQPDHLYSPMTSRVTRRGIAPMLPGGDSIKEAVDGNGVWPCQTV